MVSTLLLLRYTAHSHSYMQQSLVLLIAYYQQLQLLVEFPDVSLSRVFELINTHLVNTHGLKGQEERGAYFGRVFASLAVMQSGRLVETVSESDFIETKMMYIHVYIFHSVCAFAG